MQLNMFRPIEVRVGNRYVWVVNDIWNREIKYYCNFKSHEITKIEYNIYNAYYINLINLWAKYGH